MKLSKETHVYCTNCYYFGMELPYPQYPDVPEEPICKHRNKNLCNLDTPWDSKPYEERPLYKQR
jgi:hypothetical protein